jgi:hypothetical protein
MKLRNLIGSLVFISALFGCGDNGGSGQPDSNLPYTPKGSAPKISGFTYSQTSVVNSEGYITVYYSGTVTISDPDGDIANIIISPLGQPQFIIDANIGNSTHATVPFNFSLILSKPETYYFDVFAIDSGYNQSNKYNGIVQGSMFMT